MRSVDPTLAWEDHSTLFALFRERRRKIGIRRHFSPAHLLQMAVSLFGVVATVSALFMLFANIVLSLILWAVVAVCVFSERLMARRRREDTFPHSVRAIWTVEGVTHAHAATEIWLTGIRGGEVAKAIYLERMQFHWLFALGFYPFVYLVQIIVFPVVATQLSQPTAMLFIPLMLGGFGASLIHIQLASLGAWGDVAALVKHWKEGAGIPLRQREQLKEGSGISSLAGMFPGCFFGASVIYWAMAFWEIRHSTQIRYTDSGVVLLAGVAAGVLLIIGFATMMAPQNRDSIRSRADYLETATFPFEAYMVAVVQQDEKDARRWASWAHDPATRWQRFPRRFD